MTAADVKQLLHASPFVPFTLHLANGKTFRIDHEDFVTLSRRGNGMAVALEGTSFAMVDLLLVTHLDTHPSDMAEPVAQ